MDQVVWLRREETGDDRWRTREGVVTESVEVSESTEASRKLGPAMSAQKSSESVSQGPRSEGRGPKAYPAPSLISQLPRPSQARES